MTQKPLHEGNLILMLKNVWLEVNIFFSLSSIYLLLRDHATLGDFVTYKQVLK